MPDSESREELLKQGIATLLGKPVDQEGGGLMSQRANSPLVIRDQELLKRSFRGAQAGEGPHAEQHNQLRQLF